jgi:Holliday junction DNA helicase RuvA
MISRIRGEVLEKVGTKVVLDVGGLGYEVTVAPNILTTLRLKEEVELFTHVVIREDAWTIYGFTSPQTRSLFLILQSVNGVGPKVAFSIVCVLTADELSSAISAGSAKILESVPGVGKKMAARIILELQEKVAPSGTTGEVEDWREQLRSALMGLGYSKKESDDAIDRAIKDTKAKPTEIDISELLKLALTQSRSRK